MSDRCNGGKSAAMDAPLARTGRSKPRQALGLFPDIEPIEELSRILGEANADSSGASDIRGVREFKRREPKPTRATIGTTSILQAT